MGILLEEICERTERDVFGSSPWIEKIPQRWEWLGFPIFLPE